MTAALKSTNGFAIKNPTEQQIEKIQIILTTVGQVPSGKVATYGQIARAAGLPGHARYVGTCLKIHSPNLELPWHRVINQQGKISFRKGSEKYLRQKTLLEHEGVRINNERISLKQYQWQP